MITNLVATNRFGDRFEFNMSNRLVQGLDLSGLEADVNLLNRTNGGAYYQGSRLQTRRISLLVHLFKSTVNNSVIEGERLSLAYKVFDPLSGPIRLSFNSYDSNQYYIDCYSLQYPLARPDKNNNNAAYQIMLLELVCPDPYIYQNVQQRVDIASYDGGFEFDWEIPEEGDEFETRNQSLIGVVNYQGNNTNGMQIIFNARSQVVNPTLINIVTQERISLNFTMQTGDSISINTERGNRSITLTRNNVTTNIFYSFVVQNSTFLQLLQGDNFFRYQADSGEENMEVVIQYRERRAAI